MHVLKSDFRRLQLGQFETPVTLCDLMLDAVVESPDARILDPATGAGIFMQRALERGHQPHCLYGVEADGKVEICLPHLKRADEVHLHRGSFLEALPQKFQDFDVIIGNPPYVRHELMTRMLKAEIARLRASDPALAALPARMDSSLWFVVRAWTLLRSGGRLCFVIPNGWLETRFGQALWPWLLTHYHIESLIEPEAERWFQDAAIHACVLILRKQETTEAGESTEPDAGSGVQAMRLVRLQHPIETLASLHSPEGAVIRQVSAKTFMEAPRFLSACLESLLHECPRHWVNLSTLGAVRYPVKTGINRFFYVDRDTVQRFGIEPEFLIPAVKSAKAIKNYIVTADNCPLSLFCCTQTPEELTRNQKSGAMAYIAWGAQQQAQPRQKRQQGIAWPQVASVRNRPYWYQIPAIAPPDILCSRFFDRRFFFAECTGTLLEDQTFYGLTLNNRNPEYKLLVLALLNSTLTFLMLESHGRKGLGEGVLQFSRGNMADLPIPSPEIYPPALQAEIIRQWQRMRNRRILPIEEELAQQDRMALDERVLAPWGGNSEARRQEVADSLYGQVARRRARARTIHREII